MTANPQAPKTVEPQYKAIAEWHEKNGPTEMGMCAAHTWHIDPKRLGFVLARYKFVAKMLAGMELVLEVGCGDGWASNVVRPNVSRLWCVDIDPLFIEEAKKHNTYPFSQCFKVHDMCSGPITEIGIRGYFNAAYCLDVIEHIPSRQEDTFMKNVCTNLVQDGVMIVGTPNVESQQFASSQSKAGHVNLHGHGSLRQMMLRYFRNVFMFGMNDEVLHVGFGGMCHYLLAMGVGKR